MPSRRTVLAGTFALFAGCTTTGGDPATSTATDETETSTQTDAQTPTEQSRPRLTDEAIRWQFDTGGPISSRPVLDGDTLYLAGGDNGKNTHTSSYSHVDSQSSKNLYALTLDGTEQWRYEAETGLYELTPTSEGLYAIGGWNQGMYRSDERLVHVVDGEVRTTFSSDDTLRGKTLRVLAATEDGVFLGSTDDEWGTSGETLFAVDSDGGQRWTVDAGDTSTGFVYDDALITSFGGRETVALETETGERRWTISGSPVDYRSQVFDGLLFVRPDEADENGHYPLTAVAAADGSVQWRYATDQDDSGPFVSGGVTRIGDVVYGTEYGGLLYALDAETGEEHWSYSTVDDTRDEPVVVGETVYVASFDGTVHAVDTGTGGSRWRRSVAGVPREVHATDAGVVVSTSEYTENGVEVHRYYACSPDGEERWSFEHEGSLRYSTFAGERAFATTEAGSLLCLGAPQ